MPDFLSSFLPSSFFSLPSYHPRKLTDFQHGTLLEFMVQSTFFWAFLGCDIWKALYFPSLSCLDEVYTFYGETHAVSECAFACDQL